MKPAEIILVQQQWSKIAANPEQVALLFYDRLFEIAPEVRSLFPDDLVEQGRKLMEMLQLVIDNLHCLTALHPQLSELGQRHEEYGTKYQHYEAVGTSLLWTLEQVIGEDFTSEAAKIWTRIYAEISFAMNLPPAAVAS